MNYNYHVHTHFSRHATGTEEEYILRAIKCGIKYMGFSDHYPLRYDDGYEPPYRVPVCSAKNYYTEINKLRGKYKDKIDIKVGFEMEYFPELFDEMVKNAVEYGAEYLILGQHYLVPENISEIHTVTENSKLVDLCGYVSLVISAMQKKCFYICCTSGHI